jgi:hypothetical protein
MLVAAQRLQFVSAVALEQIEWQGYKTALPGPCHVGIE